MDGRASGRLLVTGDLGLRENVLVHILHPGVGIGMNLPQAIFSR
jgi:hypothetical protein